VCYSTSTSTAGGTGVCSAGCQLAMAGTGFGRARRRRGVGACVSFYIFFTFLSSLWKLYFYVEKIQNLKKMRYAAEAS
jgi:hypothetical protein